MEHDTHDTNASVTPVTAPGVTPPAAAVPPPAAVGRADLRDVAPDNRTRVSWGAIIAGAVVAASITILATLLGIGGGLIASDSIMGADTLSGFAIVWYLLSGTLGLLAGGYVAGRLAGSPVAKDAVIHGLTAWGVTTLLAAWLVTSIAASLISGAASLAGTAVQATGTAVGGVASGVGSATGQVAGGAVGAAGDAVAAVDDIPLPDVDWAEYGTMANDLLEKGGVDPAETATEAADQPVAAVKDFAANVRQWVQGDETVTQAELIEVVTENSDFSEAEAREKLNDLKSAYDTASTQASEAYAAVQEQAAETYEQAEARATEALNTASAEAKQLAQDGYEAGTDALGTAAIASFFVLLLGAAAASLGGFLGRPEKDEHDVRHARA